MKKVLLILIFTSTALFSQEELNKSHRNHFQTAGEVLKNSFLTIPNDFVHMGKSVSKDWKTSLAYTGGIAALVLLDKPITKFYQQEVETAIDYHLPDIAINDNDLPWLSGEDAYMSYPLIGLYAGSLLTNYEKGQYVFANSFKALSYSIVISHLILKTTFGRNRPNRILDNPNNEREHFTNDPYDFFNKRSEYLFASPEGSGFPSLHATAFFALAKVAQMEFDNYWIPYGFMALVFSSNIKAHNHWVSDMVLGGVVGTVIGRSVVKSSWEKRGIIKEKKKKFTYQVIPNISSQFQGFHFVGTF